MRYRIEYTDNRRCKIAESRKDLIALLETLKNSVVADVRKIYKSGVSDSVMDKYRKYIRN